MQACASCHFNGGSDTRSVNSLAPGSEAGFGFQTGSGGTSAPNYAYRTGDFPFHKLADVNNAGSAYSEIKGIGGSQGVTLRTFIAVGSTSNDNCSDGSDATFSIGGHNTRRVTGRNAPSNINAAFNFRNFWDGRAGDVFNGNVRDAGNLVYRTDASGVAHGVAVALIHSSAATQATGPTLSGTEMSCDDGSGGGPNGNAGRQWPDVGHKLLGMIPLNGQRVALDDSVLGGMAHAGSGGGLDTTYSDMIKAAFKADLWNSTEGVNISANGSTYTQMEKNFSFFWGLSIQLYEDTLTSDGAPIDSGSTAGWSASAVQGLDLFTGKARCASCHSGPVFTAATIAGGRSFVNTGVRPVAEDGGDVVVPGQARFKVPSLRNIELTGPYFHNGSQATLAQVVDFYNRGGDFAGANTDSQVRPLGLSTSEKKALVDFLMKLTDERVARRQAPFDSPELTVPNGSSWIHINATGAGGTTRIVAFTPAP